MTELRRFEVKSLARVEGEGSLRVRVADGRVEIAEFSIYEPPRFFEKLVRGRAIREVPDIVARICGICPVAYQLTACIALEQALGIAVTPEITALRRLLYHGEWIQSHGLHVHLLHAPDFFGVDSGIALAASRPDLVACGSRTSGRGSWRWSAAARSIRSTSPSGASTRLRPPRRSAGSCPTSSGRSPRRST
jgi:coenzyme F420-reducing hydrogenase alpha subunit